MKRVNILYIAFAVIVVTLSFMGGCNYHKRHFPCPVASKDTILVFDTITHTITNTVNHYTQHIDTIITQLPGKIDTVFVLGDYFASHKYTRTWTDSLLSVTLKDEISQNKPVNNAFSYRILRPQTIINNSVDQSVYYSKYITFGLGIPIKNLNYINVEADFNFRKGYIGIEYVPELKSTGVKMGVTLIKFK